MNNDIVCAFLFSFVYIFDRHINASVQKRKSNSTGQITAGFIIDNKIYSMIINFLFFSFNKKKISDHITKDKQENKRHADKRNVFILFENYQWFLFNFQ